MRHIELLIFDLDGTLIDSKRDIANSLNLTFREVGLPELTHERIYTYVGNGVRQLMIDAVGSNDSKFIDHTLACFEQHYLEHLLDETCLFPGVSEVLAHFEDKKIALATNKPTHYTEKIMTGLNLQAQFDLVLSASPTMQLKPHPAMLLETLQTLDVVPADAIMIGDSLNDIHAAMAAGVSVCGVGYGFGDAQTLKSETPDFFIDECKELMTLFK